MSQSLRILGFDPGTRITGYGCIDYRPADPLRPLLIDAGVIRLDEKAPLIDRLCEIEREVDSLLNELVPRLVAVEELYAHYKHPRTAVVMAHARGVLLLAARRRGLEVIELSANRVKQSLTGHGHASKEAMQRAIQSTWNLAAPPHPPDVADALAVALCCGRELSATAATPQTAGTAG